MTLFRNVLVIQRAVLTLAVQTKSAPLTCNLTRRAFSIQNKIPSKFTFNLISGPISLSKRLTASTPNIKLVQNVAKNEPTPKLTESVSAAATAASKLIVKQRPPVKKKSKKQITSDSVSPEKQLFKVRAFATADYYDLESLRASLESSGAYKILTFDDEKMPDSFICASAKYKEINEIEPRHIFFFLEGTVVFWNLSKEEQSGIMDMLHKHEKNPYPLTFVRDESEVMEYSWHNLGDDNLSKRVS